MRQIHDVVNVNNVAGIFSGFIFTTNQGTHNKAKSKNSQMVHINFHLVDKVYLFS